jgi:hypothetical protein
MTKLAPHGGCNWRGCEECFPAWSRKRTMLILSTPGYPDSTVEIVEWSIPHEIPIDGYTKVKNVYGFVMVVPSSRLTERRIS